MLRLDSNKQNIFFTSDTHFSHKNVIKYSNRPFSSIEEHDEALINNWNNVVKDNDIIFHLGDFAFSKTRSQFEELVRSLNGKKYLILGNHDSHVIKESMYSLFEDVSYQMLISIDNQKIYLNHYPFLCFAGIYKENPTWQLFGHVHSSPSIINEDTSRLKYLFKFQYDVGVDNNNYTPISYKEVKNKIEQYDYDKRSI